MGLLGSNKKEKEKEKARRDSSEPALENTLLLADNALLLFESGIALQPWANPGDHCGRVFRCLRDLPIGLKFRTPEGNAVERVGPDDLEILWLRTLDKSRTALPPSDSWTFSDAARLRSGALVAVRPAPTDLSGSGKGNKEKEKKDKGDLSGSGKGKKEKKDKDKGSEPQ